jgi:hypothetical protein
MSVHFWVNTANQPRLQSGNWTLACSLARYH